MNCLLRLEIWAGEAAGMQYLCGLWGEWQSYRNGDHPQAHDQPAKAGDDPA